MIDIEKLLKANPAVDDYRIQTQKRTSYEMFFVHRDLETVRATDTTDTDVTVYVHHDGKLGDSSFAVYGSTTEEDAANRIQAAVDRARLVFNQPWELPTGDERTAVLPSNMAGAELPALAAKVADAVFAADCYEGGAINATEIFLYQDETTVKNSRGVNKTQVKCHAMIEAIPTWNAGEESVELYENYRFTEFDAAAITAEIDRRMQEVRDRQAAVKPVTPMTINVALGPLEISQILRVLGMQVNYQSIYAHANLFKAGDDVQRGATGDRMTVTYAGVVKGSVDSASFDGDGVDLGEKTVIENGVVTGAFGESRFAQYLGQEPTGALRCVKLAPGTLTQEELAAAPYLEIVSMSGLQGDLYADYLGGEIRLAYLVEGGKKTPVTGITMSAKASEALAAMRLLDATTVYGAYEGPAKLLIPRVSVL